MIPRATYESSASPRLSWLFHRRILATSDRVACVRSQHRHAALIAEISAWTIVGSLVFSQSTVRHLTLDSSLAVSALAVVA